MSLSLTVPFLRKTKRTKSPLKPTFGARYVKSSVDVKMRFKRLISINELVSIKVAGTGTLFFLIKANAFRYGNRRMLGHQREVVRLSKLFSLPCQGY